MPGGGGGKEARWGERRGRGATREGGRGGKKRNSEETWGGRGQAVKIKGPRHKRRAG